MDEQEYGKEIHFNCRLAPLRYERPYLPAGNGTIDQGLQLGFAWRYITRRITYLFLSGEVCSHEIDIPFADQSLEFSYSLTVFSFSRCWISPSLSGAASTRTVVFLIASFKRVTGMNLPAMRSRQIRGRSTICSYHPDFFTHAKSTKPLAGSVAINLTTTLLPTRRPRSPSTTLPSAGGSMRRT